MMTRNRRRRFTVGCTLALLLGVSPAATASGDFFRVIEKTITMKEVAAELPVPDYEFVDILGDFKNAEGSVACGGTVSEGPDEDADDCMLRPQLTFTDGYLDTAGTVVTPNAATYDGKIADTVVFGYVGDIVELTVENELPEAVDGEAVDTGFFAPADNLQTIHWHGMELDNESDGTPVSETGIETGKSRLYRFRLYRPGPFWFHPHILPLLTESRGQVGRLIVRSKEEDILTLNGVLPLQQRVFSLTDMVVANETNRTLLQGGQLFEHFTDEEVENNLLPNITPDLNGDGACDRGIQAADCIVNEGELVLVNGKVPTSDEDIQTVYVREGRGVRIAFINSSNERFYRFRLLLEGEEPPFGPAERVNRDTTGQCYAGVGEPKFSGADPLSCDQGLPLYRVGGEGGLLDHVRLEGQPELAPGEPPREFDTVIRRGEDFIGPAERTDFVVVTKDREGNYLEAGDSMFIWTIDYPHGRFTPKFDNNIGDGDHNNRDVAARKLVRIRIIPPFFGEHEYGIAEGDPLLAHPDVDRPTEDLKLLPAAALSAVPPGFDPAGNAFAGTTDPNIKLDNRLADGVTRLPSINNRTGQYSGVIGGIGDTLPTQGSTRYARTGDVIEFVYANNTGNAHHPFHMHGFSFQLISIHDFDTEDTDGDGIEETILDEDPVYVYDYNEFVDVVPMQPGKAVKFRMKMTDRFKIPDAEEFTNFELRQKFPYDEDQPYGGAGDLEELTDAEVGGALGRWLFHCHILHHAGLGMISDLCVAPSGDPDASGCKIDVDENITF